MENETGVKIYNLFPKVVGTITNWKNFLEDIKYMGFNYIYINPIFETGFSNSLYAPKDFYKINSDFVDYDSEQSAEEQLKDFIQAAKEKNIGIILEIIITHVSIDSNLLLDHPEWFIYENGDVKKFSVQDEDRWVEWGDLVEIDNANSSDKNGLWNYWEDLLNYYLDFGVSGFIFEAAYRIPSEFWRTIIGKLKEKNSSTIFIGDNLGSDFPGTMELSQDGFDYLFTSFKWWNFKSTWFLEQHYKLKDFSKMISFPEKYNTDRIAAKYEGNINASKSWYTITTLSNSGTMIPIGYEFGVKHNLDVINSFEEDLSSRSMDIRKYIKRVNEIKDSRIVFNQETDILVVDLGNNNVFIFKKMSVNFDEEALIIANLNFNSKEEVYFENIKEVVNKKNLIDISPEDKQNEIYNQYHYVLRPGEVRIILGYN